MFALTDGRDEIKVAADEMYRWVESTEYLTDYGRLPNPSWDPFTPSYRASLQHQWQRMVSDGTLLREKNGLYRLAKAHIVTTEDKWAQMVDTDEQVKELRVRQGTTHRIQRSQKLRDLLVNYYNARCQICEENSPFFIPTQIPGRFYVEVHHVNGLAESYTLQQGGMLIGLRVNGIENLTVLCPHHHATIHHFWPEYRFDRENLLWKHEKGGVLPIRHISDQHASLLQKEC